MNKEMTQFTQILSDEHILTGVDKLAQAINRDEKAVTDLAELVSSNETAQEILSDRDIVKSFLVTALMLFDCKRKDMTSKSKQNRFDYIIRVTVDAIAERLGIESDDDSKEWNWHISLERLVKRIQKECAEDAEAKRLVDAVSAFMPVDK